MAVAPELSASGKSLGQLVAQAQAGRRRLAGVAHELAIEQRLARRRRIRAAAARTRGAGGSARLASHATSSSAAARANN